MKNPRIPTQLIPLVILFALLIAAFVVARQVLAPESFGRYGHYRANAVDDNINHEIVYAGYQACADCHDDILELKQQSNHRGLSCEVCHGPAAGHAEAPDEFTPEIPKGRGFCPLCHGYNPARPSGFPQILPERHNPGQPCMLCHEPHNPLLPHAPEDCNACHRRIAREKMVSHHAILPCVECHLTPAEHLTTPAKTLAEKPTGNEVCGRCHGGEVEGYDTAPRIEMATHGGRYLCWDCHYPHSPEAGS